MICHILGSNVQPSSFFCIFFAINIGVSKRIGIVIPTNSV
jgi:hypothetical protein